MAIAATDLIAMHASATPDRAAVIERDRSLTYDQLNLAANRLVHVLQDLGVKAGDKVVWCGQNGWEVVVIVNASAKAGAVSIPLNYRLAPDEAAYVIDDSDAVVVLFDIEQAAQLQSCPPRCPRVRGWLAYRCEPSDVPTWAHHLESLAGAAADGPVTPLPPETGDDAAGAGGSMIYTSGTTGKPKGVLRRRRADPATAGALIQLIGYQPGDVYLTTGPLYHSGPLGFMAIAQAMGGTVVVQRHFDPEDWLRLVERHQVTTTFSAPTPVRRVLDLSPDIRARYDYSSMRRFVANAAPWPFELKRRYVETFGEGSLWEVYGSTELGVDTVLGPEDQMRKPGSCGRPAPLVELALFDDDGHQVTEPMVPGELYVRSTTVFDTYWKAEDKYQASKRDDWITVGDVAYVDHEGFYYICDRKSDMIISGGMNIYPAEIEAVLVAHPAVADAAVFGIPSEEWGESVHAVVSFYPGRDADDAELQTFCRDHLASYKIPRSFSRLDEIPRTGSGKILKRELRAPYWEGHTSHVQ